jgi:hypothetical protein
MLQAVGHATPHAKSRSAVPGRRAGEILPVIRNSEFDVNAEKRPRLGRSLERAFLKGEFNDRHIVFELIAAAHSANGIDQMFNCRSLAAFGID